MECTNYCLETGGGSPKQNHHHLCKNIQILDQICQMVQMVFERVIPVYWETRANKPIRWLVYAQHGGESSQQVKNIIN